MTRIALLLSSIVFSAAVATPAFAMVRHSDQPSCGGGDEKKDDSGKKGSSFQPSCGGGDEKKDDSGKKGSS